MTRIQPRSAYTPRKRYMMTGGVMKDHRFVYDAKGVLAWDIFNRGVGLALWYPETNNYIGAKNDLPGLMGWLERGIAANPGAIDLICIDHELSPRIDEKFAAKVVAAVRKRLDRPVIFYGGQVGPDEAECKRQATYMVPAGAALVGTQFQRPDNINLIAASMTREAGLIRKYMPGVEPIAIIQDTMNWGPYYPANNGPFLREVINTAIDENLSLMAFQPVPLDPANLRPLYSDGWFFTDRK